MREVRQLQNELEEPTSAPSVIPSGDSTPLEWDPKALPQHDNLLSDTQLNHTMETPKTTELSHRVLESIYGLPKPSPASFNLKMANGTIAKPTGLLRDVKIHIDGIPYIVTLTVIDCQTNKSDYSMLLGRPWLRNAKVIHD